MRYSTVALSLSSLLFAAVQARTDLAGCTSSASGASLIWYVPGTGELCELIDCGGGRAPAKTTVPGCPLYSGTASVTPHYLPGYGPNGAAAASTTPASSTSTSAAAAQGTTLASASTVKVTVTTTPSASAPVITSIKSYGMDNGTITTSTIASTGGSKTTSTLPTFTGAANALGSHKEVVGLAVGLVAGLAML